MGRTLLVNQRRMLTTAKRKTTTRPLMLVRPITPTHRIIHLLKHIPHKAGNNTHSPTLHKAGNHTRSPILHLPTLLSPIHKVGNTHHSPIPLNLDNQATRILFLRIQFIPTEHLQHRFKDIHLYRGNSLMWYNIHLALCRPQ